MREDMQTGKIIIVSAPSGAGKSTLIKHLLQCGFKLSFSVSATSRPPRGQEKDGKDYYFLSAEDFRRKIASGEFLEYEEVYRDCYYGSLKSEVEQILSEEKNVIFDVDVAGGINIKSHYKDRALALFIAPPDMDELERRLVGRATDTPEKIKERLAKANYEMSFAPRFDAVIVNDNLTTAQKEIEKHVRQFLNAETVNKKS